MTTHFFFSMLKSGLRGVAAVALMEQRLGTAGLFFLLAEFLGVLEEFPRV